MGAIGPVGQGLSAGMSGYHQGKAMVINERRQEADRLYGMADRYMKHAEVYREKDPEMYATIWKAYSETMDQAEKLAGEKGQGAWKTVKPWLSKIVPGLDDGKGTRGGGGGMQQQQGMQPPPGMGQPQQPQQPQPSGERQFDFSEQGGAPQDQSIYAQMASRPPKSDAQLIDERTRGAMKQAEAFLGQYKSYEDIDKDPEGWDKMTTLISAASQVPGMADRVENMIETRFGANEKAQGMMDLSGDSDIGKYLGLGPEVRKLPLTVVAELMQRMPDAQTKLKNEHATMASQFAKGEFKPGSPEEKRFKELDVLVNPYNSEIDVWTRWSKDPVESMKSRLKFIRQQSPELRRNVNYMTDNLGNVYQTIYDQDTNTSTSQLMTIGGKPLNLGTKGVMPVPFRKGTNPNNLDEQVPDWAGMRELLQAGVDGKPGGVSPEEAYREWLPALMGRNPATGLLNLYQGGDVGGPVNGQAQQLMDMIEAARTGRAIPQAPGGAGPAAPTVQPRPTPPASAIVNPYGPE